MLYYNEYIIAVSLLTLQYSLPELLKVRPAWVDGGVYSDCSVTEF